ncbi:hypothetical protein ACFL24_01965 [Patescibacteria group bacterium]
MSWGYGFFTEYFGRRPKHTNKSVREGIIRGIIFTIEEILTLLPIIVIFIVNISSETINYNSSILNLIKDIPYNEIGIGMMIGFIFIFHFLKFALVYVFLNPFLLKDGTLNLKAFDPEFHEVITIKESFKVLILALTVSFIVYIIILIILILIFNPAIILGFSL